MPSSLQSFSRWPAAAHAAALVALSLVIVAALEALRLPAALLLGPMLAGVAVAIGGAHLKTPVLGGQFAQAVVGCLIAHTITADIVHSMLAHWPLFAGVTVFTLVFAALLGWRVARSGIVPGTTAIWGLMPGGASAMVLMAGIYGADARLVAFMQYLRVFVVTALAALAARWWVDAPVSPVAALSWFPPLSAGFGETLALIAAAIAIGRLAGIPNLILLLPMIAGAWLQNAGAVHIELPPWLLAASFAVVGWSVGLRFTPEVVAHARRALLPTLGCIVVLVGGCALLGWALETTLGGNALTAYLATSPGGADSVAVIAASANVDAPLVMAFQSARLIAVVVFGPLLSRWVAARVGAVPVET